MRILFSELFDAPDSGSGSGSGKEPETLELLNLEEDEPKEEILELVPEKKKESDKAEKEGEEEKEEEVDELKEIEEELEEPDEEKLELMTPVRRREILKKYPTLFKDFPYLEKAYYREQQFTEVFPTINDAKAASEKANVLDQFERDVMDGNIEKVLSAVKEEDQNSFNKIVDNYLPTLMKVDQQAYYHVLGNIIKDTVVTMVREANSLGENGDPLKNAATILHQFVFGTSKFTPPQLLSKSAKPEESEKENELRERENKLIEEKYNSVVDDLQTRANNTLRATIEANIDPKQSMTDYVRRNATREAFDSLEELINRDTRFRALLDRLWEKSFEEKFSKASQDRIKSAYLSKAKTLLPAVIKKARNEALKGLGKRVTDEEESSDRKGPVSVGRSTSSGNSGKAKEIPKGMKTIDYLMQD